MPFFLELSPDFEEDYARFCSKNNAFKTAVDSKVQQILYNLDFFPSHYKPLSGKLSGVRRVHVFSSFVLLFEVFEKPKVVRILKLEHHDKAYKI